MTPPPRAAQLPQVIVACPRCGASAGELCASWGSTLLNDTHAARRTAWQAACLPPDDVPALRAEIARLRARLAEQEQRPSAADSLRDAAIRIQRRAQQLGGDWLRTDQVVGTLHTLASAAEAGQPAGGTRTEHSYWVAIADALNAALEAELPLGIDLNGTLTDHTTWSVIWDREERRFTVACYDDER